MKIYLIDAFNLMHKMPDIKRHLNASKQNACEALVSKFHSLRKGGKLRNRYTLVFDGNFSSSMAADPNLKIVESRGKSADEVIKKHIDKSKNKRNLTVVSSDTEVHNYARLNGCEVIESQTFLSSYLRGSTDSSNKSSKGVNADIASTEKPSNVSKNEIKEMKRLFGLD